MYCPQCGKEIAETAKVCGYCGFRIPARDVPKPKAVKPAVERQPPSARKTGQASFMVALKKIPLWLWGTIGGVVVVLIVVMVILSLGSGRPASVSPGTGGSGSVVDAGSAAGNTGGIVNADAIAGDWSGTIRNADGSFSAYIQISIESGCTPGDICGNYRLPEFSSDIVGYLELMDINTAVSVGLNEEYVFFEQPVNKDYQGDGFQRLSLLDSGELYFQFVVVDSAGNEENVTSGLLQRD